MLHQNKRSDEDELPLHDTASSSGLSTSSFPPFLPSPLFAVAAALFLLLLDTPSWNGASVIWILLGV
jgi:hypothetical protein